MRCWLRLGAIGLVVWVLSGVALPAPCAARSRGIAASGCNGCHATGAQPQARLTALSEAVPGQPLRLLLEIETKNGPTAGFYLRSDGGGTLSTVAGQGTQALGEGIAHSSPKAGTGFVRFEVSWLAPAEPTGVHFEVWVVSANDNNGSGGDGASFTTLSVVSGCDGELYFRDADRDGYGSSTFGMRLDCAAREGYTTIEGDCDENDADINPGAEEYCNEQDDDCDGAIDEGSLPQAHYPDADGDGHGERGTESVLDCPPPPGYAPNDDDCLEGNDGVFPGATEVCDSYDNDCDNRTDERVKPTCGVGWCRRESWSCREEDCMPGEPRDEQCNAFDDDCDDALDEDVDCGADLVCREGVCVAPGSEAGQGPEAGEGATAGQGVAAGQGGSPAAGSGAGGGAEPVGMNTDAGSMKAPSSEAGGCAALPSRSASWPEPAAICTFALWLVRRRRRAARREEPASAGRVVTRRTRGEVTASDDALLERRCADLP